MIDDFMIWNPLPEKPMVEINPELQAQIDMVFHITELAKEYHDRCDAYDRQVCTGKNRYGEPMPASSYQYGAINKHAIEVLKDIKNRAVGLPLDLLMSAIKSYKF